MYFGATQFRATKEAKDNGQYFYRESQVQRERKSGKQHFASTLPCMTSYASYAYAYIGPRNSVAAQYRRQFSAIHRATETEF